MTSVAIVHDYLTQRGGAERVVLTMMAAFPGAPVYTSFFKPETTFPEFAGADIRTMPINAIGPLRTHHRAALPLLAPAFSRARIDADVVLCSSSGWAHGVRATGRKVVYCYTPARWLYQPAEYLGQAKPWTRAALGALHPGLVRWDRRAAASAEAYLTSSSAVAERIRTCYGIEPQILPPPSTIDPDAPQQAVDSLDPGFVLCVSRLLAYKNVDQVVEAFALMPTQRLVVVGRGPEAARLARLAPSNVALLGTVSDAELRWLYTNSVGLIAASYEDYGLTPLEGATFGRPVCVLRWGGFLDTVVEGRTGVFFDRPEATAIRDAVEQMTARSFDPAELRAHAANYSQDRFMERLRQAVEVPSGGSG